MCGIAGWVGFDSDLTEQRPVIAAMTDTMACRGPDDSGTWVRRNVALGHRRLGTIDLPGGRQPMTMDTPRGTVAMIYTGEVYNFAELREVLRHKGHTFLTASDTEVVLHGYLEWGEGVAQRLNGMFAFAVWDEREERLVLVRDRLGVKPLYIYPTPDGVLFGSEPKAILANPRARRVVGVDGLRELFGFTMTPGWALWEGMREVLPGTTMSLDRHGIRTSTYWTLPAAEHTDDQDTTVERVRELMTDIVHRQLVADVPRCVLLSGGLDSSAVTGIAAAHLAEQGERLRTFSVDFVGRDETFQADENWDSPDAPYIRDVANLVGSRHRFITLDPGALADPALRRAVITARDLPVGLRRDGHLALPAVPGDQGGVDGRAVRRVGRRGVRRVPVVPRPGGGQRAHVPVARLPQPDERRPGRAAAPRPAPHPRPGHLRGRRVRDRGRRRRAPGR